VTASRDDFNLTLQATNPHQIQQQQKNKQQHLSLFFSQYHYHTVTDFEVLVTDFEVLVTAS